MSATLVCTLLALAAPAVQALGFTAADRGAGANSQEAARVQPAGLVHNFPRPVGGGSARELLGRELRSRAPKSRVRRTRKSRGARGGDDSRKQPRKPKKRSRRTRPNGSSKGSRKIKQDDDDPSLCAKHIVEKEVTRSKGGKAHVLASTRHPHPVFPRAACAQFI